MRAGYRTLGKSQILHQVLRSRTDTADLRCAIAIPLLNCKSSETGCNALPVR